MGRGPRRHGIAEGSHATRRPRHRLRQPEGARASTTAPSCRACFFDFGDMRKANATGYFPYTPSLPMLYGLRESLAILHEEGLENVFARHHRLAEGTRAAVKAWGLELCARAPEVALRHRQRHHGSRRRQRRRGHRHRVPPLQPGARRGPGPHGRASSSASATSAISTSCMLLGGIAGAEMAMRDVGVKVTPGSGVAAAAGILAEHGRRARQARPATARARRAARRGRAITGEGHRRRRPMSHTRVRAGSRATAAQRAGGAGLAAGDVREGARQRGGRTSSSISRTLSRRRTRNRRRKNVDRGRCWSTTGARAARRSASASTASIRTTCIGTWWTSSSRPAIVSTRS